MALKWKDFSDERKALVRARSAEWKKAHPDRFKEYAIKWKAENREKVRANHNRWVAANPEKYQECQDNKDPIRKRISSQNNFNKKSGGKLSWDLVKRLFDLQKGKCACCGESLGDDYQIDHITPTSKGGANEDWNIQLLRKQCNLKKGSKNPVNYMQEKGFLI